MVLNFRGWKPSRILVALVLLFTTVMPLLNTRDARAALLPNRLIRLSSSEASATSVTYHVEFEVGTTDDIQGIVVDFCDETPITGDPTCTTPTGFDIDGAGSIAVSGQSGAGGGEADLTGFTTPTVITAGRTLSLTNGTAPVTWTAGETAFFDITTVTNPSAINTSFFARIYTYDTNTGADNYTVASPGTYIDAGGIALSTAEQVIVTAKVAERLEFCVYVDADFATTPPTNDCLGKSGSSINLGDANSVLDPNGEFINKEAFYGVTTNASGSVAIRLKGGTLQNGSNDIDAIGATPAATSPGAEQFGLCNYEFDSIDSNLVPTANKYDGEDGAGAADDCLNTTHNAGTATAGGAAGDAEFAFDSTETTSTYGDAIVSKPAGNFSTGNLVFIANISNTTVAGIYTTTLTFIATGTY